MKMRQILIGAMVVLLTTGSPTAWSHPGPHNKPHSWGYVWSRIQSYVKERTATRGKGDYVMARVKGDNGIGGSGLSRAYIVPEIDAASGTSAIALLAGMLLLASERTRFKRS
jgi:hypothetical protein